MKGCKSKKDRIRPACPVIFGIWITFAIGAANLASATAGVIDTYAGGGPTSGETATLAGLGPINGALSDSSGNIFFSTDANRVWRLNADGTLTLIAGTGASSSTGDGAAATAATLNYPRALAFNSSGDLFIAEAGGKRIRKIDHSTKFISTYAGTGTSGSTGDNGLATAATIGNTFGIAINSSDDVFIADTTYDKIRKVDHSTGVITTYAGNGSDGATGDGGLATAAKLSMPRGIAFNSSGDLYIADSGNHKIRMVDHSTKYISTVAGTGSSGSTGDGGLATAATLTIPYGITFNSSGDYFISDYNANVVRKVDHSTKYISTVAGTGTSGDTGDGGVATIATISNPFGITFNPSGDFYIGEMGGWRIRKVDHSTSHISTVAGNGSSSYGGDSIGKASAQFSSPNNIAFDPDGNLIVSDSSNYRLRKIDASTGVITTIAGTGTSGSTGDAGPATSATVNYPHGIAFNSSGDLIFADTNGSKIRKIDHSTGVISTIAGTGTNNSTGDGSAATAAALYNPFNIAFNSSGDLYIADTNNHKIRKIDHSTGVISTVAGTGTASSTGDGSAATSATLNAPHSVAFDSNDDLYIVEYMGHRIRKVDHSTGIISTVAGTGTPGYSGDGSAAISATLRNPNDIAIDANNNLFIAEASNNVIRKVDHSTGIISTVAGTGVNGFSGDGGSAVSALLSNPYGVALNSNGDLYLVEAGSCRIRSISQATADVTAPSVSVGFGTAYSDSNGASYAGYGHSYIRMIARDAGGYGAFNVTDATNALATIIEEKTGESTFVTGASTGTTHPVYAYLVKEDNAQPASFTFSLTDKTGNYGAPSLTVSSLSFAKKDQTVTRSFNSVAKDQGKVSILADSGDLRNAFVVANGETVEIGDVPAGTVRTVDLRSRLRAGTDNAIELTATGDAGASATALASSATLDRIDQASEANRTVYRRGDANEDGRIDVRDAAKLLRFLAGLESPTATERALCDIDLDGSLTAKDATTMIKLAVAR